MKDDLQLPANGRQTKQSVTKTSKSRKQSRRRSRRINISSIPADTISAKETDQYTSDMEKMKRSTDIKQAMHRPAEQLGLPEVCS